MIIENDKGNKKIILVDSISNLNAVFNIFVLILFSKKYQFYLPNGK